MNWGRVCLVVRLVFLLVAFSSLCCATTIIGSGDVKQTGPTTSLSGDLGNPDNVALYAFHVMAPSMFALQTWSYGGGTNAAGDTFATPSYSPDVLGGFLLDLALYDPAQQLVYEFREGYDPGCPIGNPDFTGNCGDLAGNLGLFTTGAYTLVIMTDGTVPSTDLTCLFGPCGTTAFQFNAGGFNSYYGGATGIYAVDLTLIPVAVPEPVTVVLCGGFFVLLHRLRAKY